MKTGQVKITLRNDEIGLVKGASKVRITNGWEKEWNKSSRYLQDEWKDRSYQLILTV